MRWYVQGSGNVYTALAKRFYVPDPDLGWRISTQHPIWLGLDVCAAIAGLMLVLAVVGWWIRRRTSQPARGRLLRVGSWCLAAISLCVPAAAFVSGAGPLHARDTLPATAAVLIEDGIEGSLDAPEGSYVVVTHAGTAVTAHLSAGGEAFDARFGDVTGTWRATPRDLRRPLHAEISVAAASVDTGVGERSKHAREGYLHADEFPRIGVTLDHAAAVRANGPRELAFRAPATVSLMGRTHAIDVTGTLTKLDAAPLARLGLAGDVLLVQADFALVTRDTALAPKAHDLDGERIPIHVSLVLRHTTD
ncbi:MAG TPA: YceI family protein [Kofleriaceae bacterium]|nr:YceI family protein [Kofleriaceae bacterium]